MKIKETGKLRPFFRKAYPLSSSVRFKNSRMQKDTGVVKPYFPKMNGALQRKLLLRVNFAYLTSPVEIFIHFSAF